MLMEWQTIQIGWVLMKQNWKRGFREDVRGLKQVSHEKPFKMLFLGDSQLVSREMSHTNFRESRVSRVSRESF